MSGAMRHTRFMGLEYLRDDDALLTDAQVDYGLRRLWALCAGDADWQGQPALRFRALTRAAFDRELDLPPGALPWVATAAWCRDGRALPLDSDRLPALFQTQPLKVPEDRAPVEFPLDLVAASFAQLTRLEEHLRPRPDAFGCHDENASIAVRQGFRERPLLDEWALALHGWLQRVQPGLLMRPAVAGLAISHDIDVLRYYKGPMHVVRALARKLLKESQGLRALNAVTEGLRAWQTPEEDPCVRALDQLMDFSEACGTRSTFYFMSASPGRYDDGYDVGAPVFRAALERLRLRGHEAGWHPGFEAAQDDVRFTEEYERLSHALGMRQFGARHHFLRWDAARSPCRLQTHGCTHDASVGYNYHLGFRASTARAYPAYDLAGDQPLKIEIRPLVAMDGPLLRSPQGLAAALTQMRARCQAVGGTLSLLVHNYTLMSHPDLTRTLTRLLVGPGATAPEELSPCVA